MARDPRRLAHRGARAAVLQQSAGTARAGGRRGSGALGAGRREWRWGRGARAVRGRARKGPRRALSIRGTRRRAGPPGRRVPASVATARAAARSRCSAPFCRPAPCRRPLSPPRAQSPPSVPPPSLLPPSAAAARRSGCTGSLARTARQRRAALGPSEGAEPGPGAEVCSRFPEAALEPRAVTSLPASSSGTLWQPRGRKPRPGQLQGGDAETAT